jgi:uncharacterized protein YdbL (DUF1318 family)
MSRNLSIVAAALLASACVTINVYFPAAAAQKAADRVIDEVWGAQPRPVAPAPVPASPEVTAPDPGPTSRLEGFAVVALDWVVPAARAAEEPDLNVSSPEIKRLTESMEARFNDLAPYFASGAVGLTADGYVAVHDNNLVPLPDRNKVRTLVANETADRAALYREIANANNQPQWEPQIRSVFAKRWIARAQAGWWVQNGDGSWGKK